MSMNHPAVKTAAFVALSLTVGVVLPPALAHAGPPTLAMSSSIRMAVSDSTRSPGGNFMEQVVYIDGLVSMSQAAAQDTINHGNYTIALRYWGDDTNDDDLLAGPLTPTALFAAPDGLHFERATALTHAQLDEDNGTFENIGDGGIDEIYVGARLLDANGNTVSKVESNRIEGDF